MLLTVQNDLKQHNGNYNTLVIRFLINFMEILNQNNLIICVQIACKFLISSIMNTSIKLSLDTRRIKKDGSYPIILRITHFRSTTSIKLGQSIPIAFWDEKKQQVRKAYKGVSSVNRLNNIILKEKAKANDIINKLSENKELSFLSIQQLKNKLVKKVSINSFFEYGLSLVRDMRQANRFGTANSYNAIIQVLKKYNGGKDLKFNQINLDFLNKFEKYHLRKGNSINGLAVYMKTIRAIYNKAIKEDLVPKEAYPFENYKIRLIPTEKRALEIDSLKLILNMKIAPNQSLFHYRNYFLISYMFYGISFMDLAFLKLANIKNDRLNFQRKKTSKQYSIKITTQMKSILSYYIKNKNKEDYIFPIIKRQDSELQYKDVIWARKRYNMGLKEIAEHCNIEQRLTSYVSRHSFATHAMHHDIPLQAISAMLGHSKLNTTQIYLKTLPNEVLDGYNERMAISTV